MLWTHRTDHRCPRGFTVERVKERKGKSLSCNLFRLRILQSSFLGTEVYLHYLVELWIPKCCAGKETQLCNDKAWVLMSNLCHLKNTGLGEFLAFFKPCFYPDLQDSNDCSQYCWWSVYRKTEKMHLTQCLIHRAMCLFFIYKMRKIPTAHLRHRN